MQNQSNDKNNLKSGWTLFKPDLTLAEGEAPQLDTPARVDLLLRTARGESRAHVHTTVADLFEITHEGILTEPGTQTSSGGQPVPFKLQIQPDGVAFVHAHRQVWTLQPQEAGHAFAFLDRLPPKGSPISFADLAALAAKKRG